MTKNASTKQYYLWHALTGISLNPLPTESTAKYHARSRSLHEGNGFINVVELPELHGLTPEQCRAYKYEEVVESPWA